MENTNRNFAPLTEDIFDSAEFSSAWFIGNRDELKKRKYMQEPDDGFSLLADKVYFWVGENRDKLRGLTLEEQEEIMITEGIITRDDI